MIAKDALSKHNQRACFYKKTQLVKKRLTELIKAQLSHSVLQGIRLGRFSEPQPIHHLIKESDQCVISPLELSSKRVAFINYMTESCQQFREIYTKILDFGTKCEGLEFRGSLPRMYSKKTRHSAVLLLCIVIENIDSLSKCGKRQNFDSIFICILFYSSEYNGFHPSIFFQTMHSSYEKYKSLNLEQIRRWRCFLPVGKFADLISLERNIIST